MAAKKSDSRASAHVTTDRKRIRAWIEERGGHPAVVKRTRGVRGPGILRVDFPGYSGEGTLEPIEWDEFFDLFERAQLAFLYQEETGGGRPSRFNKFVHRDTMSFEEEGRAPARRSATGRAKKTSRRSTTAQARGRKKTRSSSRSAPRKKAAGRGRSI